MDFLLYKYDMHYNATELDYNYSILKGSLHLRSSLKDIV